MFISSGWSRTLCDMSVTTGTRFHSFFHVWLGTVVQSLLHALPLPSGPDHPHVCCDFVQPWRSSVITKVSLLLVLWPPWFHNPISFWKWSQAVWRKLWRTQVVVANIYKAENHLWIRITCKGRQWLWAHSNTTHQWAKRRAQHGSRTVGSETHFLRPLCLVCPVAADITS